MIQKKFVGKVIEGFRIGSSFGIATANLEIFDKNFLEEGVYIVSVKISETVTKGGLLHWGKRKTFGSPFSAEVHILDFDADIYGDELKISVEKFLRPVKVFANSDALFTQIEADIQTGKKYFLRQSVSAEWKKLSTDDLLKLENNAIEKISKYEIFLNSDHIILYAPTDQEINFVQKICSLFPNKKYYFPRVKNKDMDFFESKFEDLQPGKFGILEPIESAQKCDYNQKYLVFVAGQAFDENGNRMGRGGGFYDKFLARLRTELVDFYATAVIPKFAYYSDLPIEVHDEKVDEIILV